MQTPTEKKQLVREKYAEIAEQDRMRNITSCCGATPAGTYTIMSDSYAGLAGYDPDADLGLGCGLPTEIADIREGDTVLDLGSGAGNDCFVARAETGPAGKVIGVDFTPAMLALARKNAEKRGFNNVEFRQGDIEDLPVSDDSVDVVVSNCVLNLVPDKAGVFREIMRVLRPGGHFAISDVVLRGDLPPELREAAELYAGCVSGAMQEDEYLSCIKEAGFEHIAVRKRKPILLPDEILSAYLTPEACRSFAASGTGIFSITVYAGKPDDRKTDSRPDAGAGPADSMRPRSGCGPGCC